MLNRVVLIGRLANDPELKYTPSGIAVSSFRIAVDRRFANSQGEREQGDLPRALDRVREEALMPGAGAGRAARDDLAAVAHEAAQPLVHLVIDFGDVLDAEVAHLPAHAPVAVLLLRGSATAATSAACPGWHPSYSTSA